MTHDDDPRGPMTPERLQAVAEAAQLAGDVGGFPPTQQPEQPEPKDPPGVRDDA